jgi:hypothetical protein
MAAGFAALGAPATVTDETAKAEHLKADRVVLLLGISTVIGVVFSCAFGLYFLSAIGMQVGRFFDVIATGLVIAGGAKPLQDFIASIQNKTTPKTKTAA